MALGDYKVGDRGSGVTDLQKYLNEVGIKVTIDGVYGPETQAGVRAFQQARGIVVDGIAGPQTLVALSQARAAGWRATASSVTTTSLRPFPTASTPGGSALAPPAKTSSKWTGLIILMAIAIGVWIFTSQKRGGSFAGSDEE